MREGRRGRLALLVALALGALAVAVGFATRGNAASVNSCPTDVPTPPAGDTSACWTLFAAPSDVSVGSDGGLLIAKFHNLGNGTANHVTVSGVSDSFGDAGTISVIAGGVSSTQGNCTSLPCVVGQVPGGGSFKVFIRYTLSAPGPYNPQITLTFDERNGTSPTSDTNVATTSVIGDAASGSSSSSCLVSNNVQVSTNGQIATVTDTPAAGGLPCLPTTTTITSDPGPSGSNLITSFTLASATQGFVVVTLQYATLANGVNYKNLPLVEITDAGNLPVDACLANGLPQATNPHHSTDSCIFKRAKYLSQGATITLHVVGMGVDPRYGY
jgi:hypothetical protein